MFEINWTNQEDLFKQTQKCFKEIEGIDELIAFQNRLFDTTSDNVCFGDAQIDGLEYPSDHSRLTVYLCYDIEKSINGKQIKEAHYVIDFFNPEIKYFNIEFNTHWIDEVYIQKNEDGKYSISFGMGECDFRYTSARVNRCWTR